MEKWKIYKVYKASNQHSLTKKGDILYVSNLGKLKLNDVIINTIDNHHGYFCFGGIYSHRAIAECFVPNPDNKPFVDHINGDKLDNRAENLRWVTRKENMNNPNTLKKISESQLGHIVTDETKQKISEAHKGKTTWNKGKKFSEESKQKMSEAHKGRTPWNKGKRFYNNGIIQVFTYECPNGYKIGKLKTKI